MSYNGFGYMVNININVMTASPGCEKAVKPGKSHQ